MATVESSSSSWNGQGLVHQTGPFKPTAMDRMSKSKSRDGMRSSTVNPYQINATGTLPTPSAYATAGLVSVLSQAVPMKKRAPMGNVKRTLTLGSRAPMQTGHKMGNAPSEIVDLGAPQAEFIYPTIKTEPVGPFSVDNDVIMGSPSVADSTSNLQPPAPQILGKRRGSSVHEGVGKKGKGVGKPGPSILGKRRVSSVSSGGGKKGKGVGKPGPSLLGKRKGLEEESFTKGKYARTIFHGPLAPEPINVATKRKTEDTQAESVKKIKARGRASKPGRIDTSIGKRFIESRKENKSKPNKYDQLPSPKTRAQKQRADRR
jgi:hypothetical protein